ncbi:MAG: hypothetical protein IPP86_02385 [Bacteroidetes bacterium]|nr:hypothetical protein [Bacteroidota bacterium]
MSGDSPAVRSSGREVEDGAVSKSNNILCEDAFKPETDRNKIKNSFDSVLKKFIFQVLINRN